MNVALNELTDKALLLPTDERVILAQRLWDSLNCSIYADVEQEWLDEAEKRWIDIEQGRVACISAKEAMRRARASLRK